MINNEAEWYCEEVKGAEFGDSRLTERYKKILGGLSTQTEESIPGALDSWGETQAAYRFLANSKVSAAKILSPHRESTIERIKQEEVILLPQDTSELNYSSKTDIKGLGPLNTESHRGFLLHPVIAVTPKRLCLGVVSAEMWARESIGNKSLNRDRRIEDKESMRWLRGFEVAEEVAKRAPHTLVVNIADREGDIYEFFQKTGGIRMDEGAHWLIRSTYNRKASKDEYGANQKLWGVVENTEVVAEIEFELPSRGNSPSRRVRQEVRYARVKLGGARRPGKGLAPLEVTAILASEINAPAGAKKVEWLLLSSLPIENKTEALRLIEWYLCRWEIELFFKVLKSGCTIEQLQLEEVERLYNCVALYMIIAWRVMYVLGMGRAYPGLNCQLIFNESEWKSVYCKLHKKQALPATAPTLGEMVILVARLGGFLARKGDGYPGIKTTWVGLQRMHDYAQAWLIFKGL